MPAARIEQLRVAARSERVSGPHGSDEAVAKQRLRSHLRADLPPDDAGFEIDGCVAQPRAFPVGLGDEGQADPRRLAADAGNERGTESLDEALAVAQREAAAELREIECLGRPQDRPGVADHLADPFAQFERAGRRNETAPGPDQQRVARRLAQARKRAAHRRRAQPQAPGGTGHAAFGKQHIKRDEQVEVGSGHGIFLA